MEWLFLLLPVAAASGWWAARRSALRQRCASTGFSEQALFRGLNYLLNEQPDKAIDVFLKFADVDADTAETYLTLGALFRRRGEVDRAIRIHQDLIARATLPAAQRGVALYELGRDYLCAGLFDRAECLFKELVELQLQRPLALRALIEIYQQEKDWARCLETAEQLTADGDAVFRPDIAQFHCELAEQCLRDGTPAAARAHLQAAQAVDPACIRASLLQADMELSAGNARAALTLYQRVAEHGPRYVPALLPNLLTCYAALGYTQVAQELAQLFDHQPSRPLMLALATALEQEQGPAAAQQFLTQYLRERADLAGVERLLQLRQHPSPSTTTHTDAILLAVVQQLLAAQAVYQCDHCGFAARVLHWQCPSCKRWGSIKALEAEVITAAVPLPTQLLA